MNNLKEKDNIQKIKKSLLRVLSVILISICVFSITKYLKRDPLITRNVIAATAISPRLATTPPPSSTLEITHTVESNSPILLSSKEISMPTIISYKVTDEVDANSIKEEQHLLIPSSEYILLEGTSTTSIDNALSNNKITLTPQSTRISHSIEIVGYSANGLPIKDYVFGKGSEHIVFVGGIHGGYEWNTILLAYEMIEYFSTSPHLVPETITLHIIPSANPDGQFLVINKSDRFTVSDVFSNTIPGRFNGNIVDLNRNWDCQWQSKSTWGNQVVSAGEYAFSEPETQALRDMFLEIRPIAVGFWHSKAGKIFASSCNGDLFLPSVELAELYAQDSYYPTQTEFSAYLVTGDASDWLATEGIPAITIELTTSVDTEFERNIAGLLSVLRSFSQSIPE